MFLLFPMLDMTNYPKKSAPWPEEIRIRKSGSRLGGYGTPGPRLLGAREDAPRARRLRETGGAQGESVSRFGAQAPSGALRILPQDEVPRFLLLFFLAFLGFPVFFPLPGKTIYIYISFFAGVLIPGKFSFWGRVPL